MNENVKTCITHLDEQASRALLPTYSDLLAALDRVLKAMEWHTDDGREAFEFAYDVFEKATQTPR
jgi:hypothetical protein